VHPRRFPIGEDEGVSAAAEIRPSVDVVVPFSGPVEELEDLVTRLELLELEETDSLTIVDNRPLGSPSPADRTNVIRAAERQSSYHARNRGARTGSGAWLVFLDADVQPGPRLLDHYFGESPREKTAVLAGRVVDAPPAPTETRPAVARYTEIRASMSQANTMLGDRWSYAQTANCAVRRAAFESVGGFCDDVRSGGDADLCWRLRDAGWGIEPRPAATVTHQSRRTLSALLRQRARHGAGAAWLDRRHPGALPRKRWLGLARWTLVSFAGAAAARMRGRRDDALVGVIEPLWVWAFEFGRLFPNEVRER
jgi:GT2 family glycosyltransferase